MIVRVSKPNTMRQKGSVMLVAVVAFIGMLEVNAVDHHAQTQAGPSRLEQAVPGNLHVHDLNQPHQGTSTAHQVGGTRPETIDLGVGRIIRISESQKRKAISDFLMRFRFTAEQARLSTAERATIAIGGLLLLISAIGPVPPKDEQRKIAVETITKADPYSILYIAMGAAFNDGYGNYLSEDQYKRVCSVFLLPDHKQGHTDLEHTQEIITSLNTVALEGVSQQAITKILELAIKLMLTKPYPSKIIDLYEAAASLMLKLHQIAQSNTRPQPQALHLVAALIDPHTTTNNGIARTFLAIGDYLVAAGKMEILQEIVIAAVIKIIKKSTEQGAYTELMGAVVGITPYISLIRQHFSYYCLELESEFDKFCAKLQNLEPTQPTTQLDFKRKVKEMKMAFNEKVEYDPGYYDQEDVYAMLDRIRGKVTKYNRNNTPRQAFMLLMFHLAFLDTFGDKLELYNRISEIFAHLLYIAYRPRGNYESVTRPPKKKQRRD